MPTAEEMMQRLERRFGAGKDKRRGALYRRIVAMVELHGETCYKALCEVAAEAAGMDHPDRYFCFAVVRRFSERGFVAADF